MDHFRAAVSVHNLMVSLYSLSYVVNYYTISFFIFFEILILQDDAKFCLNSVDSIMDLNISMGQLTVDTNVIIEGINTHPTANAKVLINNNIQLCGYFLAIQKNIFLVF